MKKRIALFIIFCILLTIIPTDPVSAADAGITTLDQAVQAALTMNSQSSSSVTQANTLALNVADTVIDLDFNLEKVQALEEKEKLLQQEVNQGDVDFKTGKIDAKTLEGLHQEITQNEFDLNFYHMKVDNSKMEFQKLTGEPVTANFDYRDAYLITDAGKLALPPSAAQSQDATSIEKQLNDVMSAFSNLGTLISAYIKAGENYSQTENDFKTGKASQDDLTAAQIAEEDAKIDALEGKAQYSKLLYGLDCSLQGYISRSVKKISNPIFQSFGA